MDKVEQIEDLFEELALLLPTLVDIEDDIEDDYKYQRDNFYNLVEKGSAAIDGILELAKESEHPRTYEVAGLEGTWDDAYAA